MPITLSRQRVLKPGPLDNENGLLVWYPFANGSGVDASGHGYTGTLQGTVLPAATPDTLVTSLVFDGSTSYVDGSDAGLPANADPRTMSVWFKCSTGLGNYRTIVSYGTRSPLNWFSLVINPFEQLACGLYTGDLAAGSVSDGNWHHGAVSFDGTTRTLFIDGLSQTTDTPTVSTTLSSLSIGRNIDPGEYYPGSIGDVRIYNRCLSPAEVHGIYAQAIAFPLPDEKEFQALQSAGGGVDVSITGVSATAAVGTPTVTGFANVTLTGVAATAAVGTLTTSAAANVTLTGVAATAAVNIPTVSGKANVTLTGVSATAAAGDVTVTVGGAVNVSLTGVSATAAVGTPTVTGLANVTLTGTAATAAVGTLTTSAAANATLTGVAATAAVNTPTITGFANVTLAGVLATVAAGDITVSVPTTVSVTLTGVSASAQVGTLSVTTNLDVVIVPPEPPHIGAGETILSGRGFSRKRYEDFLRELRAETSGAKAAAKAAATGKLTGKLTGKTTGKTARVKIDSDDDETAALMLLGIL